MSDWVIVLIILVISCPLWFPLLIAFAVVIFEGLASVARGIRGVPEPTTVKEESS